MRTHSFEQNITLMPDGPTKALYLKIINTPQTDFQEMTAASEEYTRIRLSHMTEKEREEYLLAAQN